LSPKGTAEARTKSTLSDGGEFCSPPLEGTNGFAATDDLAALENLSSAAQATEAGNSKITVTKLRQFEIRPLSTFMGTRGY
jgi:hypothetical protein